MLQGLSLDPTQLEWPLPCITQVGIVHFKVTLTYEVPSVRKDQDNFYTGTCVLNIERPGLNDSGTNDPGVTRIDYGFALI